MGFKDRTAIVGIGQTDFAKRHDRSELELGCEAIRLALVDAGIEPEQVDAMACYTFEETPEFEFARNLGFGEVHFLSQSPYGGGAGCGAVGQVALAIAAGVAKVGVVWRSRKRGDPGTRMWASVESRVRDHWKWSRPQGLVRPVDEVAMLMRRHMHEHGTTREQLGAVAQALRVHASRNPNALMAGRPMTREDYLGARIISDPLCLFDNCLESDGAIALVVTSAERARDLPHRPVFIHAFSQGMSRQHQLMTDYHGDNPLWSSSRVTAANLWRQADISPKEVSVAQFYDAFSPLVLFSLEAYGFCETGESGDFVARGGIALGGALPSNTSGGSLSEVYLHGLNLVTEAVRQLRGTANSQVADAETALVTSCDGTPNGALLLRR